MMGKMERRRRNNESEIWIFIVIVISFYREIIVKKDLVLEKELREEKIFCLELMKRINSNI